MQRTYPDRLFWPDGTISVIAGAVVPETGIDNEDSDGRKGCGNQREIPEEKFDFGVGGTTKNVSFDKRFYRQSD